MRRLPWPAPPLLNEQSLGDEWEARFLVRWGPLRRCAGRHQAMCHPCRIDARGNPQRCRRTHRPRIACPQVEGEGDTGAVHVEPARDQDHLISPDHYGAFVGVPGKFRVSTTCPTGTGVGIDASTMGSGRRSVSVVHVPRRSVSRGNDCDDGAAALLRLVARTPMSASWSRSSSPVTSRRGWRRSVGREWSWPPDRVVLITLR